MSINLNCCWTKAGVSWTSLELLPGQRTLTSSGGRSGNKRLLHPLMNFFKHSKNKHSTRSAQGVSRVFTAGFSDVLFHVKRKIHVLFWVTGGLWLRGIWAILRARLIVLVWTGGLTLLHALPWKWLLGAEGDVPRERSTGMWMQPQRSFSWPAGLSDSLTTRMGGNNAHYYIPKHAIYLNMQPVNIFVRISV